MRHLTPYWDVHRHRIAPQVADVITEMLNSGQLTIFAGRIREYQALSNGVAVTISRRKTQTNEILQVHRVVNCTGVAADYRRSNHPLVTNLRTEGLIRPNILGLGLDANSQGALYEVNGTVSSLLYTLGTPRKGDLWETIAVPELRGQAQALSQELLQSLPLRVRPLPAIALSERTSEILQSNFLFRQFFDPQTSSYTYLIADQQLGDAILVDPVLEQVDRDLESLEELGLKLRYCLETHLHPRFSRSRSQFITIMNNLKLSYPQQMNTAVLANEYCGDFIPQDSSNLSTTSAKDEEQKQIELTVTANTDIYNDYFAMYI